MGGRAIFPVPHFFLNIRPRLQNTGCRHLANYTFLYLFRLKKLYIGQPSHIPTHQLAQTYPTENRPDTVFCTS